MSSADTLRRQLCFHCYHLRCSRSVASTWWEWRSVSTWRKADRHSREKHSAAAFFFLSSCAVLKGEESLHSRNEKQGSVTPARCRSAWESQLSATAFFPLFLFMRSVKRRRVSTWQGRKKPKRGTGMSQIGIWQTFHRSLFFPFLHFLLQAQRWGVWSATAGLGGVLRAFSERGIALIGPQRQFELSVLELMRFDCIYYSLWSPSELS